MVDMNSLKLTYQKPIDLEQGSVKFKLNTGNEQSRLQSDLTLAKKVSGNYSQALIRIKDL